MSKVSRRDFIKFGAVSALAASGVYASDMPVLRDKDVKFDEEWDVVILGSGFAGLEAGIKANERGNKVPI